LNISRIDVPFVLINGDRKAGQVTEPITLYLTFIVSPNTISSPISSIEAVNPQSTKVNSSALREATSSMAQDFTNITRSTATGETPSLPTDHHTSTHTPLATDRRAEISSAENALQIANEAMATMNLLDTWEGALERIKWVMDAVSPVAEVCHEVLLSILG
jgi:hypothetical protein